ncbi:methyl-accepting chemotaxis protein [Pseudoroseicyclus sp. CXY001]|uniref:methyl-accepting chemotaxis protein n=1 Tax=Pseudoroseicyclus sp. CXY001 TaxID=3242492 RepID=UPI00358DB3B9
MVDTAAPSPGARSFGFSALKVSPKIFFVALMPLTLIIFCGVTAWRSIVTIEETAEWVEHTEHVIGEVNHAVALALDMETGLRGYLLAGEDSFLDPYREGAEAAFTSLADLQRQVRDEPNQVSRLAAASAVLQEWHDDVAEPMIAMRRDMASGRPDAPTMSDLTALVLDGRGKALFDDYRAKMAAFIAEEQMLLYQREEESTAAMAGTARIIPTTISLSVLLGGALAILIGRSISRSIGRVTADMRAIAEGRRDLEVSGQERGDEIGDMARGLAFFQDLLREAQRIEEEKARVKMAEQNAIIGKLSAGLSDLSEGRLAVRLNEAFPSEYEQLRQDFNRSVETLSAVVEQLVETSGSIHRGAEEISGATGDLSLRTERQAATLEETAAAMEELTVSVGNAANSARDVANVTEEARHNAESSGKIVDQAVEAMSEIENSARQIVQIVKLIDDIAFQTNLLALNAGVEAARAGETGKGFAVVAAEVRALAQRSSEAAADIKSLIDQSSRQVETGVVLVGDTGKALHGIVGNVSRISSLVSEIAQAANEQSMGIGEINTGVGDLDHATQQNAAMAEQATAVAKFLANDASKLDGLVARFELGPARLKGAVAPAELRRAG